MISAAPQVASATTPQELLAAILDSHHPDSLLTISQNPVPVVEEWLKAHPTEHHAITAADPLERLAPDLRVDLAVVAEQLEFMNHNAGEELVGRLRNLHTGMLVVLYQPGLAPEKLRWNMNDFIAMGMRREGTFLDGDREMNVYSYDLAQYNFKRTWNNPRFWANPENWGKYWW